MTFTHWRWVMSLDNGSARYHSGYRFVDLTG